MYFSIDFSQAQQLMMEAQDLGNVNNPNDRNNFGNIDDFNSNQVSVYDQTERKEKNNLIVSSAEH